MSLHEDTLINSHRYKDRIFQSLMTVLIKFDKALNYARHIKFLRDNEGKGFRFYRPEDKRG